MLEKGKEVERVVGTLQEKEKEIETLQSQLVALQDQVTRCKDILFVQ